MSKLTRWYCVIPINRISKQIFLKAIEDHPTVCMFSNDFTKVVLKFQETDFPAELNDLKKMRIGEFTHFIRDNPEWNQDRTFNDLPSIAKTFFNNLNIDPNRKFAKASSTFSTITSGLRTAAGYVSNKTLKSKQAVKDSFYQLSDFIEKHDIDYYSMLLGTGIVLTIFVLILLNC